MLTETGICRQILVKLSPNIKFRENPLGESRVLHADRNQKAHSLQRTISMASETWVAL
jgi:hypothetical protein